MPRSEQRNFIESLAKKALAKAAVMPWYELTLVDLCAETDVRLSDCAKYAISKMHVADQLDAWLDQAMLNNCEPLDASQSTRDRVFDVVMARYDAMEENREGWVSILSADAKDAVAGSARRIRRARTSAWALEASGQNVSTMSGAGRAIGLARILRLCDVAWRDDGPDLAKTMACLDHELRKSESLLHRARDMSTFLSSFGLKVPEGPHREPSVSD